MTSLHRALVVEDSSEHAQDLRELLLEECGCDCVVVSNKEDALKELAGPPFCVVLVDLQILPDAGAVKAAVRHGRDVLRAARQRYPEGNGTRYATPIVVVSGFAREEDEAVAAMKDGASDVLQKLSTRTDKANRISIALEETGRTSHSKCQDLASTSASQAPRGKVLLAIPARRELRRFVVTVGGTEARLRVSTLKVLLYLVKGKLQGKPVFRGEMQKPGSGGFKLVSELRRDIEHAWREATHFVTSDQHGYYSLDDSIAVGELNLTMLETIDERGIAKLAREIRSLFADVARSDGKG